jgi:hypothetical protein
MIIMIKKLFDKPSFSLFNNYEFINKLRNKVNEIIETVNSGGSGGSGEVVYSLDERKIGSWLGNDLYQKTIKIEELEDGVYTEENFHNTVVNASMFCLKNDNTESYSSDVGLIATLSGGSVAELKRVIEEGLFITQSYPEESLLDIHIPMSLTSDYDIYVTIQYYKNS